MGSSRPTGSCSGSLGASRASSVATQRRIADCRSVQLDMVVEDYSFLLGGGRQTPSSEKRSERSGIKSTRRLLTSYHNLRHSRVLFESSASLLPTFLLPHFVLNHRRSFEQYDTGRRSRRLASSSSSPPLRSSSTVVYFPQCDFKRTESEVDDLRA